MKLHMMMAAVLTLALPIAVRAQQAQAAGASVSGTVFCADTNAPARFAKVLFKSTSADGGNPFMKNLMSNMAKMGADGGKTDAAKSPEEEKQMQAQLSAANKAMSHATDMLNASTVGMNGEYSLAGLKPGTYYIHAVAAGYVDPLTEFTDEELASTDPAVKARIAAKVQIITVNGNEAAHVDLRLERGAAVSGRVLFDDGSPASGWMVSAIQPGSKSDLSESTMAAVQALTPSGSQTVARTDDMGNFRLSGLAAGEYALRAGMVTTATGVSASNISEAGSGINLAVYSGDTFDRAAAKAFKMGTGENRAGADITVPQRKLHNIVGHVAAKTDNHMINTGTVTLTEKDNPGLELNASIHADGSFRYEYLPAGTYELKIGNAADSVTTGSSSLMGMAIPKKDTLRKYASDAKTVTLADMDVSSADFTLAQTDWVPPAKKLGAKDEDPAAALGALFGAMMSDDGDGEKPGAEKPAAPAPAAPPAAKP